MFYEKVNTPSGKAKCVDLFTASQVKITRHVKIKADATPFDPNFLEYFIKRTKKGITYGVLPE